MWSFRRVACKMRPGRLFILALLLSSCIPASLFKPAPPDPDPATLETRVYDSGTVLYFFPCGSDKTKPCTLEAFNLTLELRGNGLLVSTPGCEASGIKVTCTVARVPVLKVFAVPFSGKLESAEVNYYRADGKPHTKRWP